MYISPQLKKQTNKETSVYQPNPALWASSSWLRGFMQGVNWGYINGNSLCCKLLQLWSKPLNKESSVEFSLTEESKEKPL